VTAREGAVSDSRHAVTPRQSIAAVVPASRTLAWMSSSHADDVLYAVKLEVNEIASVEAQTRALAVGERRAPRAVVACGTQVTSPGSMPPPWQMTSTAAPSGTAARAGSRVHGGRRRPRPTQAIVLGVRRIGGRAEASAIARGVLPGPVGSRR
jgi:hypothetical protein